MILAKLFGNKGSGEEAADAGALQGRVADLEKQRAMLIEHNKMMIKALEFYADQKSWEEGHKYRDDDDATIFADDTETAITADKGKTAQRALDALKRK